MIHELKEKLILAGMGVGVVAWLTAASVMCYEDRKELQDAVAHSPVGHVSMAKQFYFGFDDDEGGKLDRIIQSTQLTLGFRGQAKSRREITPEHPAWDNWNSYLDYSP
jgi:hypothetical protein